jgi:hypothetical protein
MSLSFLSFDVSASPFVFRDFFGSLGENRQTQKNDCTHIAPFARAGGSEAGDVLDASQAIRFRARRLHFGNTMLSNVPTMCNTVHTQNEDQSNTCATRIRNIIQKLLKLDTLTSH